MDVEAKNVEAKDVEAKRREFIEKHLAIIDRVNSGLDLLEEFGCLTAADQDLLNETQCLFVNAQLPRDRAKLEKAWIAFQIECDYWAWKFAYTWSNF